jgi:hypothetical protein
LRGTLQPRRKVISRSLQEAAAIVGGVKSPCLLLLAAIAVVAGCGGGDDHVAATTTPRKRAFTVTSTLDGKHVLPHHIRWLAMPKVDGASVKSVAFLIDGGKPRWVETQPPYTFGDDEKGAHQGYLVTSWLAPGKHRFSVRAVATDGRTATDTVVAGVPDPPRPPKTLGGTWERTISDTSAAPGPGAGNPTETLTPPGTYKLVIDERWMQVRFPGRFRVPESDDTGEGWILDSDYVAGPKDLRVYGAVTFDTHHGQAELGWWCWEDGPPATYVWSTKGDTLTLKPKPTDACTVRSFIWAGRWTRVRA